MPTTTSGIRTLGLLGGAALALAAWFGGVALVALVAEPASVVVFAPKASAWRAALDADGLIVREGRGFVVLRSRGPGFVRRLYADGAWLVWPSMPRGCFGGGT